MGNSKEEYLGGGVIRILKRYGIVMWDKHIYASYLA